MDGIFPVAFMDAPRVLNASVTPIPGAASLPLEVVHNLGTRAAYAIDYIDSTGDYIGVYLGAANSERLATIIGGGVVTRAWVTLPAGSRISLKSITSSPITNGYLSCTFMGFPPGNGV